MVYRPFTPTFEELTIATLKKWHVPGVAFSVVHGDDSWSQGFGVAALPSTPITPSTLFYAASTTKAHLCAAWAVYIASEANQSRPLAERISFSTPLANLIRDDFLLAPESGITDRASIEDALSHRTGMPPHETSYGYDGVNTPKDVTRNLRHLPLHTELRTQFEYCNTMYIAASHALETVTGKPLSLVLRESLWHPLGMRNTYAGYGEASKACKEEDLFLAKGCTYNKLIGDDTGPDGELVEEPHMDFPEVSGAGYAITTPKDYIPWMRNWLNPSHGPLTEEIRGMLWTPRMIIPEYQEDNVPFDGVPTYALGWFISTYKGHRLYWHPGALLGGGSYVLLVPRLKWGVSLFGNATGVGNNLAFLAIELLDDVLNVPREERYASKAYEDKMLQFYKDVKFDHDAARKRLYPKAPQKPTQPLVLPMAQYAGTYFNSGHGQLKLKYHKDSNRNATLVYDDIDRTWAVIGVLEHVNGNYWMVTIHRPRSPIKRAARAESRLGADGQVQWFGIAVEPSMPDNLIWFERR